MTNPFQPVHPSIAVRSQASGPPAHDGLLLPLDDGIMAEVKAFPVHGKEWLPIVMQLHQAGLEACKGTGFLLEKTPEHFENLLAWEKGTVVLLTVGDKPAGMLTLTFTETLEQAIAWKCLGYEGLKEEDFAGRKAFIQSLYVSDQYKGFNLSGTLLKKTQEIATEHGCKHIFAQGSEKNIACTHVFPKAKMPVKETWEAVGGKYKNLYYTLTP